MQEDAPKEPEIKKKLIFNPIAMVRRDWMWITVLIFLLATILIDLKRVEDYPAQCNAHWLEQLQLNGWVEKDTKTGNYMIVPKDRTPVTQLQPIQNWNFTKK